ncbi:peptidoglycan-binding protein [Streptomyces sp. SCA3-4]|uniref:peptidoglycan-binding domain-containing protein n=1 Tax=Streptomyces sichuanensis TaxID=2871810 RepID=UPI001CE3AB3B|nr:peptidoglycan-binding protein [Streptomyces sichuanensis]MCA6091307.1 peptidoglycan-binding protein [Streptomyces sichuanensis]
MQLTRTVRAAGIVAATAFLGLGGIATQAQASSQAPAGVPRYTCDYTDDEPTLSLGSKGLPVKQAQCQLDSVLDRHVKYDGDFGPDTKRATQAFQQCAGLPADGIIGPNTWRELNYWWWNNIDCHK